MRRRRERSFGVELPARRTALRLAGMPPFTGQYCVWGSPAVTTEWRLGNGSRLLLVARFSNQAIPLSAPESARRLIYSSAVPGAPGSASFHLSLSAAD